MLKIKPIGEKQEQERLCNVCSCEYLADSLAYSCYDDGTFAGVLQFHFKDGGVYIDNIDFAPGYSDNTALFIMGRAALNYSDLVGFHDAYFLSPNDDKIARMIGFRKNPEGIFYFDLRGFFEAPCSHDNN